LPHGKAEGKPNLQVADVGGGASGPMAPCGPGALALADVRGGPGPCTAPRQGLLPVLAANFKASAEASMGCSIQSCLCQPLPVPSALAPGPPTRSRSVKLDFVREGSPTDSKANAAGVPDRQLLVVFQANRYISVQFSGPHSWQFLALVVFSAGADVTRHLNQSSRFANFRRHSASSDSVSGTFHPKNSTPNLNCANHSAGWLSAC